MGQAAPAPAWDAATASPPPRGGPGHVTLSLSSHTNAVNTSAHRAPRSQLERGSCLDCRQGHPRERCPRCRAAGRAQPTSSRAPPGNTRTGQDPPRLLSLLPGQRRAHPRPRERLLSGPRGLAAPRVEQRQTRECGRPCRALPPAPSAAPPPDPAPAPGASRLRPRSFPTATASAAGDGPTAQPGRDPARLLVRLPVRRTLREPLTPLRERGCFWRGSGNTNTSSFPGNPLWLLPSRAGRPRGPVPRQWPNTEPRDPPAPGRVSVPLCGCRWQSFMASARRAERGDSAVPSAAHGDRPDPHQLPTAHPGCSTGPSRRASVGFCFSPEPHEGESSVPCPFPKGGAPGYPAGRNLPPSPACDCRLQIRGGQGGEGRRGRAPAPRRPQTRRGEWRPAQTDYGSSRTWRCKTSSVSGSGSRGQTAPTGPARTRTAVTRAGRFQPNLPRHQRLTAARTLLQPLPVPRQSRSRSKASSTLPSTPRTGPWGRRCSHSSVG